MRFRRALGLVRGVERDEGDPGKRGLAEGGSSKDESRGSAKDPPSSVRRRSRFRAIRFSPQISAGPLACEGAMTRIANR